MMYGQITTRRRTTMNTSWLTLRADTLWLVMEVTAERKRKLLTAERSLMFNVTKAGNVPHRNIHSK